VCEVGVGCFVGLDDIKNAETLIAQVFRVTSFFSRVNLQFYQVFAEFFFVGWKEEIKINKLVKMQAITF
jgi:hypothetical protein